MGKQITRVAVAMAAVTALAALVVTQASASLPATVPSHSSSRAGAVHRTRLRAGPHDGPARHEDRAGPGAVRVDGGMKAGAAAATPFYGLTLSELQVGPVGTASAKVAEAQVLAASAGWRANTVRLQIAQDKLTHADGRCPLRSRGCLAYYDEIRGVVDYALRLGLAVVINDTTEPVPSFTRNEPMPTRATEVFWKDIARAYAGHPGVIFDLFNEPRGLVGTGAPQWRTWRDGGSVDGIPGYLGMQTILSYVRNTLRAPNMVWADGLDGGGTLNGILPHHAPGTVDGAPGSVGRFALSQRGDAVSGALVYSFHHPMGDQDRTAWWRDFGYLSDAGYPVIDGEWNDSVDGNQYCGASAPQTVPAYLSYLAIKHIGLTAWELGPNINPAGSSGPSVIWSQSAPFNYNRPALAASPASYQTPTTMAGSPAEAWDCAHSNNAGPGLTVKNWLAAQQR